MASAPTDEDKQFVIKLLRELFTVITNTADYEANNNEDSGAQDFARRVRDVSILASRFLESKTGSALAVSAVVQLANVFRVFGQFLALQGPAMPLIVIATAICGIDRVAMARFKNRLKAVEEQEAELQRKLQTILEYIDEAVNKLTDMLHEGNLAENAQLKLLIHHIELEIRIANETFVLLKEWVREIRKEMEKFSLGMRVKGALIWLGTAVTSGVLCYTGKIPTPVAASAALIAGVPYMQVKWLLMSADFSNKLIDVHRKELHLRAVEVKLRKLQIRLQGYVEIIGASSGAAVLAQNTNVQVGV